MNPEKAVYAAVRDNARRRGVGFFITFDEFLKWVVDTSYMKLRGRDKDSLSIDRKRPELGYRAGNLQVLTVSENSKKYQSGECWPVNKESKEDAGTPF